MIGIGTNTPIEKLDIHPRIKFRLIDKLLVKLCRWYFIKRGYSILIIFI